MESFAVLVFDGKAVVNSGNAVPNSGNALLSNENDLLIKGNFQPLKLTTAMAFLDSQQVLTSLVRS